MSGRPSLAIARARRSIGRAAPARSLVVLPLAAALLPAAAGAQSVPEVRLRISRGAGSRIPLAIVSANAEVAKVLAFDLEVSGYLKPGAPDPEIRLEAAASEDAGREPVLSARMTDVERGELLLERRYQGQGGELRDLAHRLADDVVAALAGEKGIATGRLLAERREKGVVSLVLLDYDGAREKPLVSLGDLSLSPAWSADARWFTFTTYASGFPDVVAQDFTTGKRTYLSREPGMNGTAAPSPDGERVALTLSRDGNPEVYVVERATGEQTRITYHKGVDTSPAWSPDGRRLAFVSDRGGTPQIYVTGVVAGATPRRVTLKGSYNTSPDWSPDGARIAYCSREDGGYRIAVLDVENERAALVSPAGLSAEDPSWAPDGRHLVFSGSRSGRRDLYLLDVDEATTYRITGGRAEYTAPAWSPAPKAAGPNARPQGERTGEKQ